MRVLVGLIAGLLAVLLVVLVGTGVSVVSSLTLLGLAAVQVIAGAIVWTWVTSRRSALELLGMGVALGTGIAVVSGMALVIVGVPAWGWLILPLGIIGVDMVRAARRRRRGTAAWEAPGSPSWAALAIGSLLGLGFIAANLRNYPLTWTGTWNGYHSDMPFFEALSTSLARLGPFDSIFFSGGQIRYHWITYAWSGLLTESSGAEPFVVLTRVLPTVSVLGSVALVVAWSRRVSARPWVPSLAALLLLSGGFVGAVFGGILSFDSPSQSMGVLWLLAYAIVVALALGSARDGARWWGLLLVAAGLAFLLGGGKVSAAVPAVAGIGLVAVVGLLRREAWALRALWLAIVSMAGVGSAYLLILSGSAGSGGLGMFDLVDRASSQQGLNPLDGMRGVMLGTVILMVAMLPRWAGLGWLVVDRSSRWDRMTIFGVGMAVVGIGAVAVFNGFNEIWFALAASAPLAVLSAQGVGDAVDAASSGNRTLRRRLMVASIASAAVIYAVVWALWQTGASGGNVFIGTWRWAGPLVAVLLAVALGVLVTRGVLGRWAIRASVATIVMVLVFTTVPGRVLGAGTGQIGVQQPGLRSEWFSIGRAPSVRDRDGLVIADWPEGMMDAAAWLRTNAGHTDLLATNLTFGPFVPGVTGLPTYVSALQYQAPYGFPSYAKELLRREGEVWDFLEAPSDTTVAPLCEAGVVWLWVDPRQTPLRSWEPWAEVTLANDDVLIARLVDCDSSDAR